MKLLAYLINGTPVNEMTEGYNPDDLNGNPAFKISETIESGYADITSIDNLYFLFDSANIGFLKNREMIKVLMIAIVNPDFSNWGSLTLSQKQIVSKLFLAPYSLRITVVTDSEDSASWIELLSTTKIQRAIQVESMRMIIGKELRLGTISFPDTNQFYIDTMDLLDWYIFTNNQSFYDWLNSDGVYASNGFNSKSYYTLARYTALMNVLVGYNF